MTKWADYGISAVQYDEDHSRISKLHVHKDNGETIGAASVWQRKAVIEYIESGTTFCTILKTDEGKWKKGADVHLVTLRGEKFLRTDKNSTPADNLENLPEF